jgi:hypothetical protein
MKWSRDQAEHSPFINNGARIKVGAPVMSSTETHMDSTRKSGLRLLARIIPGAALAVALSVLAPNRRAYAAPACPASITACGCTITQSQIYTVANDLNAAQTTEPICIEIAKDRSILNTMGFTLTGSGNGIGIKIDKGADRVIVEGGQEDHGESNIMQWDIGIEDDGDDAVIQIFAGINNNSTTGVLVNKVKNSIVGSFILQNNGKYGVMVSHSSRVEIDNLTTLNGEVGQWLDSSDGNHILGTSVNNVLGTWLLKSSNNVVIDDANVNNTNSGLVIGCGLDKKNCTGNERSDNNYVVVDTATGNTNAGVLIRKHSGGNTVTLGSNSGNGSKMDMVDENNNCGSNVWYNNVGQGNQSCIH